MATLKSQSRVASRESRVSDGRVGLGTRDSRLATGIVRARAIVLALLLIPLDSLWIIQMERIRSGPYPTTISLFANAVFVLAVLVLLTHAARRFRGLRGLALTQA